MTSLRAILSWQSGVSFANLSWMPTYSSRDNADSILTGIVIDAATWSLPLFVIWNLKSSTAKKLELSGLFALGLL